MFWMITVENKSGRTAPFTKAINKYPIDWLIEEENNYVILFAMQITENQFRAFKDKI